MTRRIVVMRHATAEQHGRTDFHRGLSRRGRAEADAVGAWLSEQIAPPDLALVSAASRAVETWHGVCGGAGWGVEPQFERGLYTAMEDTALDLVRRADDSARTVMLLGHNPTMASVATLLDDGLGDAEATSRFAVAGYPAGCVAVFEYAGDWCELSHESSRLVAFHAPE